MTPDIKNLFTNSFKNNDGSYADKITQKEIDILFENKLYKCFLPEEYGGLNISIAQTLELIEKASYINGSLGWLIQIGNGGMYFAGSFPEKTSLALFSKKDALIAGSGTPTATATFQNGVYTVSGSWKFCSGADFASYFTVTFLNENGQPVSAILPREQVIIIQDWETTGLKNTSTHTIQLDTVSIPEQFTFHVTQQKYLQNNPAFSLPFVIYAQAFFIHVVYGTFNRMIEEAEKISYTLSRNKERVNQFRTLVSKAAQLLKTAHQSTDAIVQNICNPSYKNSPENELRLQQQFIAQSKSLRTLAFELYSEVGIRALYSNDVFSIFYHDLMAASQHKLLNAPFVAH